MKKIFILGLIATFSILSSGCAIQDKITDGFIKLTGKKGIIKNITKKSKTYFNNYEDGNDAIVYKIMNDNYNQIVKWQDTNTGADTYAFRVQTDVAIRNDGTTFNYELGRIIVNEDTPKKSKCTYNYRASYDYNPVIWHECSEKSFLKSIPLIADKKKKAAEPYIQMLKEESLIEFCSLGDNSETQVECQKIPESHYSDEYWQKRPLLMSEQLEKLRNTTL